ncbi:EAL domain-containing protein [Neobacillus sp. PS3-34]|uniref:EAL domain-containing protein n=1 Tax=Neobacillus sp. PS3-34 TaxID=3070678 RepID=UPI0027DEE462|nr:EAL domain-containing protein [Neobacillus sp. PS3-34]WML49537.1 EAL domain-containing protein [Neobacillus sp. PS3-34]
MIDHDNDNERVNILIVDDRPENLLALEAIIERSDYNLIKAFSGEEALIHLLKYEFAVILMDVQMPGVDGFETAKIIKARERTKNIPIIFITANNIDSKHIFTGYSVGAIDYILKPFDPFILKAKIEIFVKMYKINKKNLHQTDILIEKTKELETANKELSYKTAKLRESEALAKVISETSIDSMIIMDSKGIILNINPAFEKMFQFAKKEILGESIYLLFSNEQSRQHVKHIFEALNNMEDIMGNSILKEVKVKRKDGTLFFADLQVGKKYVKNKCIVACTIRDVTKKKQDKELITHMAYHDGLTNLPNRRLFNDQLNLELKHAKEQNKPLAILYLDMDRFKFVNDSLGHVIGDRLLQGVSKRLKEYVRANDLIARVGGDEFNIILPDTNRESAIEIAEKVLDGFKIPFIIDKYELFITTSIGISIFPYDGEDAFVLIKNADAALYRAKEQGKNMLKFFHSGMNIHSYKSFILQNELRKAIEGNELTLYFQPRIELETGSITSAEVLLRWNHPDWGVVLPSEFIPLAEETAQIVEMGEWVLKAACKQIKTWQEIGLTPIRLAVNFSPRQFLQKDLTDKIRTILSETGISAKMLEIEITESTLMENEERIINVLNDIRKMGVTISIDDFGTGYSSLSYLRKLPVHTLKIDKSFIQDISINSPDSIALVSTILSIGNSLNMSVIAEGVETEEQLGILKTHHCKEIQGYLICRPVPEKEFELFMLNRPDQQGPLKKESFPNGVNNPNSLDKKIENPDQKQEILNGALSRTKDLYAISSREMEVFKLIIDGLSNKEISEKLFISEHTVKNHITRILQKLNVSDRLQAMAIIYQTCIEESQNLLIQ